MCSPNGRRGCVARAWRAGEWLAVPPCGSDVRARARANVGQVVSEHDVLRAEPQCCRQYWTNTTPCHGPSEYYWTGSSIVPVTV
jgi:hypothetical protein